MGNINQCRDIKKLNVLVQVQLNLALEEIKKQGVNPLVVETLRTKERQEWLYAQGRTRSGPKVTWTLNSIHITGYAVDIIAQRKVNGKMTAIWDANDKQNKIIQNTLIKYGFEAGVNWKTSPDSPHYQVKNVKGRVYSSSNTNYYITTMVQIALNKKLKLKGADKLVVDGNWGKKSTTALNKWRKQQKWVETSSIGQTALKKLLQ